MQGYFGESGKLYFEIELVADDGSVIAVDALLDTGFTEWVAINTQDINSLAWLFVGKREMYTARGYAQFNLYAGSVIVDGQKFDIPVVGGKQINEVLIGLKWLENMCLIVDQSANILTLE